MTAKDRDYCNGAERKTDSADRWIVYNRNGKRRYNDFNAKDERT